MIIKAARTYLPPVAVGVGLVSSGHSAAQDYERRLIKQCAIDLVAARVDEFIDFLVPQKCLALTPGVREYFDDPGSDEMWQLCDVLDDVTAAKIDTLVPVFTALRSAGIDVIPIKVFDMIDAFPSASGKRFINDADPMARSGDMDKAHHVVPGAGFRKGAIDTSRPNAEETGPELIPDELRELTWMLQNHHQAHSYFKLVPQEFPGKHVVLIQRYVPGAIAATDGKTYVSRGGRSALPNCARLRRGRSMAFSACRHIAGLSRIFSTSCQGLPPSKPSSMAF